MKNNFRKRSLALALAAAGVGTIGMMTNAVAVQLADDGLGEVLIGPYFTTNGGYKTLFHVTNTSDKAVAYKIRLRDTKNSRDCRDFNVILSPRDMWTASIELGLSDGTDPTSALVPRIWTNDNSCTSPTLPLSDRGGRSIALTSLDYDGGTDAANDGAVNADDVIDRCREGYIEIIEMGTSDSEGVVDSYFEAALHDTITGIPADCGKIATDFNSTAKILSDVSPEFDEPENVLKGAYTLVSTTTGQGFGGDAVTLANFFSPAATGIDGASPNDLIFAAGDLLPNLSQSQPKTSVITNVNNVIPGVLIDNWDPTLNKGADPVSAVLMRANVINEWSTNPGFGSNTDWAVTFPTKSFYVDVAANDDLIAQALANPPFTNLFNENNSIGNQERRTANSCDEVGITSWDREEKTVVIEKGFSPKPRDGEAGKLCFEANVITFNAGNVLKSNFSNNVDTKTALGKFGWTELNLTESNASKVGLTSLPSSLGGSKTYQGLPVVGFAVLNRSTGKTSTNYGALFDHAYTRQLSQ